MNTAQKTQFVLAATKSYPVKGGSARQLYGEIKRDADIVARLFDKVTAGKGGGRYTKSDIYYQKISDPSSLQGIRY